jgi:glycosyltransferase involved in cell wall biosynthesis
MRVLQLCNKPPLPSVDGGCLAMHSITEMLLNEGIQVTVLAINTAKHPFDSKKVPKAYIDKTSFQTTFVDTKINPLNIFLNLFTSSAYNIERFYAENFEKLIVSVLKENEFDIVLFESLYLIPYLKTVKKHSSAKVVLRAHNVEHLLWERRAREEKNIFKKRYFNLLSTRIKKYEIDSIKNVNAVIAISPVDELFFQKDNTGTTTITTPFGINIEKYNINNRKDLTQGIFFIGALDWQPNVDGLLWFIENVWKKVSVKIPDLKLHIAGKNTPQTIKDISSGQIIVEGEVPDAIEFMSKHNIMIAPLFSGGGMRVKIVEGMALGKTIITTTIGAEGIPCTNGENILIADTSEKFSEHLIECINDKNYCNTIGNNAKVFAQKNFDNNLLSKKLANFHKSLLTQTNS